MKENYGTGVFAQARMMAQWVYKLIFNTIIKYHNQTQLMEEIAYFSSWFQRERASP